MTDGLKARNSISDRTADHQIVFCMPAVFQMKYVLDLHVCSEAWTYDAVSVSGVGLCCDYEL